MDSKAEKDLRERYPHGHPKFFEITLKELQLHSDKNHDYAGGGDPMGNFNRVSAILAMYPRLQLSDRRVLAMVYALKQVDAVLWQLSTSNENKVEGLSGRLPDISVYSKLIQCMEAEDREFDEAWAQHNENFLKEEGL